MTHYDMQPLTLDEIHKKYMETFKKKKDMLPKYKNDATKLKNKLDTVNGKIKNSVDFAVNIELIKQRSAIINSINDIDAKIYDIENNVTEMNYYYKIDDTVVSYYTINDVNDNMLYNNNPELHQEKQQDTKDVNSTECKLKMLNNMKNNKKKPKKTNKKRKKTQDVVVSSNILACLSSTPIKVENNVKVNNKAELFNIYKSLTDDEYVSNKKTKLSIIKMCSKCNVEKIREDSAFVCSQCGEYDQIIADTEKTNNKDAITDSKPGYPYKKINHFNEWLAQFMARESSEISKDIYNKIIEELAKNKITDYSKLTIPQIKKILKKLKLNQYYEHITHIISKLSGKPPPSISRNTEVKLKQMFKQIQEPFELFKPKNRINFLSYSYTLHKFCQLLELDKFIKYFPLLKSREKLRAQDNTWEKICNYLRWQYIPSV